MSDRKPSAFFVAWRAWGDVVAASRAIPLLFAVTSALSVLPKLLDDYVLEPDGTANFPAAISLAVALASSATWAFVLAPLEIAIQRRLLVGDAVSSYRPVGIDRRSLPYWFYSVLIASPLAFSDILDQFFEKSPEYLFLALSLFVFLVWVFVYFSVRLAFLFPAIAMDSRFSSPTAAYRLSFGRFWRIFAVCFWTNIPLYLLAAAAGLLFAAPDSRLPNFLGWLFIPITVAVSAVAAAAMARLFHEAASADATELNPR